MSDMRILANEWFEHKSKAEKGNQMMFIRFSLEFRSYIIDTIVLHRRFCNEHILLRPCDARIDRRGNSALIPKCINRICANCYSEGNTNFSSEGCVERYGEKRIKTRVERKQVKTSVPSVVSAHIQNWGSNPSLKVDEVESTCGVKNGVALVHVRLSEYKWLVLELDRGWPPLARNTLERLILGSDSRIEREGKTLKPVDGARIILKRWPMDVLHDQIGEYTMVEVIVDLGNTRVSISHNGFGDESSKQSPMPSVASERILAMGGQRIGGIGRKDMGMVKISCQ
ncbi:hypothetical protein J3A83DRAFT_4189928 [Scleroderma citrinum]